MTPAERQALQTDLAWTGHYNGIINGEVSDRLIVAIKAFQKDHGGKQTGVLNPQERSVLAAAARKSRGNAGWKTVTDAGTGVRLGLPARLVPQQSSDGNGTKWSSSTGTIQILLTRRKDANLTTASLADHERKEPAGRKIEYSAVKPDFFVLSGTQGLKKFYVRGQVRGSEARILTILYDQATEGTMEPVVIAMSSAFDPFPVDGGPPPRKTVEYGTGVAVSSDGAIVTDRDVADGCQSTVVAGHGNADKIAEDKDHGLALLRIYGARGLRPIALDGGAAKGSLDLVGIADPQNQGGGSAVSRVKASVTPAGSGGEFALCACARAGFFGRGGARYERKIRRPCAVEAGGRCRAFGFDARRAGRARTSRGCAGISEGEQRDARERSVRRESVRGACHLRAEIGRHACCSVSHGPAVEISDVIPEAA